MGCIFTMGHATVTIEGGHDSPQRGLLRTWLGQGNGRGSHEPGVSSIVRRPRKDPGLGNWRA